MFGGPDGRGTLYSDPVTVEEAVKDADLVVGAVLVAGARAPTLVSAETGSGKTLAYLIPLSQKILAAVSDKRPGTRAVILVPTRELAQGRKPELKNDLLHWH